MNNSTEDRIKSFLIGVALPVAVGIIAVPYLTGQQTKTRRGIPLSPAQAFGWGIFLFGMGLCVHAIFFAGYDVHPAAKYVILAAGAVFFGLGLWLQF